MGSTELGTVRKIFSHLLLILVGAFFLSPFLWMVSTSLKANDELFIWPPVWIPHVMEWSNYPAALDYIPFFKYLKNTLTIAGLATFAVLLSCPLVAYSLARIPWRGAKPLFAVTLIVMMLPYQVTMIPIFIAFKNFGWVGTSIPLWLPAFFGAPFFIFLLRQFFMGLPKELEDAARIDGASELRIYWQIILPLCRPALLTIALFQFMGSWTDYQGPLIYLSDDSQYTLMLGMQSFKSQHGAEWQMMMATLVMITLPIILLYFFVQRAFIRGITFSGIK
ncbi:MULTISPECIES: carbohydrate ABC transporter permease [Paenibacillus]|uniref:Carbohydrate ABC transporter permease n=2 Tax=Paenibacillus TaxID=44249 RepID=A0ABU6DAT2_9BACL|nr:MULTISPECIES: carbohydrate ABC transporter permease [Paenibacillus]MBA2941359.1 carbohydrate ABC transporter permease [Paenibacillus sp. CGMCC 1.16610]MCY9659790.1 carbohydrate ABC transporter permease [Paenibacillus anseongense]MEB4794031.1 carbohydrate ABC transporter permease [Paenibacillus chondroitinus]MVQ40178.1 ABC transporter permease subunit [Paenibacillus anseongense]